MPEDDRAVMERLAALEAEVKADAEAQRARKAAALVKVREQRAQQLAERDQLRTRQAEIVSKKKSAEPEVEDEPGGMGALDLAIRANKVKQELVRKPKAGEKSVVKAGIASLALGPLGWLYAGSLREAVPAAVAWIALAALLAKFPVLILMPVLFVALPLSGIIGGVYASQYNKTGKRQRLFGKGAKKKQLKSGQK